MLGLGLGFGFGLVLELGTPWTGTSVDEYLGPEQAWKKIAGGRLRHSLGKLAKKGGINAKSSITRREAVGFIRFNPTNGARRRRPQLVAIHIPRKPVSGCLSCDQYAARDCHHLLPAQISL